MTISYSRNRFLSNSSYHRSDPSPKLTAEPVRPWHRDARITPFEATAVYSGNWMDVSTIVIATGVWCSACWSDTDSILINELDQSPLSPPAVKFAVEDPLPRAEVESAVGHRDHHCASRPRI
jgi:hypothetical protein